ncbi:MAG: FAD-dependent oxidoreductase [Cyclobacteriaceae bacterium]|nr:FAD-dependent oxidoreductase [Cyclobacteriaceae bacterium SS2]
MKALMILLICLLSISSGMSKEKKAVFIQAESFDQKGGWFIDQQSMDVMGSPYLLAHGMGTPVDDAMTKVVFPEKGKYRVFIRTRNWTAQWSDVPAGRFQVLIDGKPLDKEFGVSTQEWSWIDGGVVDIKSEVAHVGLRDLTGFNGRCDAIYFTAEKNDVPPNDPAQMDKLVEELTGKKKTVEEGEFDFVIVGGGMAGTCAAISAARLGVKVALIQNRPVLGGNNSSEVRVHLGARINLEPYPNIGNLVNEIGPDRGGNAQPKDYYEDDKKLKAVLAEPNISLFLNHHANKVETRDGKITKVYAENIETGEIRGFSAPMFADCTGDGTIGFLAGAEYMTGRESRDRFNEPTAPVEADNLTMGISVQWFSEDAGYPVAFPDIEWGLPWNDEKAFAIKRGDWDWETGMGKDMINETEFIRDYGLLVVYSNWSYLKNNYSKKEEFANERLKWVAYVGGKRESRRLVGDYILTENELRNQEFLPDGTAPTSWTIDLHYPDPENLEKFDGEAFRSIAKHTKIYPYPIPFRCLYSKNVNNLMMGGRDISVSHVALGTVRLMRTGGMMGEVLGMAASVCKEFGVTPREIYESHFADLEELMLKGVGDPDLPFTQTYNKGGTLLETVE